MRVPTTQTALRLPDHLLARVALHAKRMARAAPKGAKISRTDAVIALLESALAEAERAGGAS